MESISSFYHLHLTASGNNIKIFCKGEKLTVELTSERGQSVNVKILNMSQV